MVKITIGMTDYNALKLKPFKVILNKKQRGRTASAGGGSH